MGGISVIKEDALKGDQLWVFIQSFLSKCGQGPHLSLSKQSLERERERLNKTNLSFKLLRFADDINILIKAPPLDVLKQVEELLAIRGLNPNGLKLRLNLLIYGLTPKIIRDYFLLIVLPLRVKLALWGMIS